ncbi:uncharacterized protein LOC110659406 [Hevea brasiliensis]|uniref:uncharacterized protein LOC110659406 n=1 Tax=Hevea brasiliensis TaxID=3981 RepID=UPI0025F7223B|nr:uncharacterized protein LOC110659406 [Hevea brasiliensis]
MAVASSSTSSTTHVLHRVFRPPPPQPPLLSFFRPLSTTTAASITRKATLFKCQNTQLQISSSTTLFSFLLSPPITPHTFLFSHSLSTSLSAPPNAFNPSLSLEEEIDQEQDNDGEIEYDDEEEDIDSGSENLELEVSAISVDAGDGSCKEGSKRNSSKVPNLTVKEKKELASYAHGLGKKLKCQLVGKSGVTENVATSFIETLEANELLKIKIHRTCPGELEDVVQQLEETTGSVVVGQIGRTVIVYRPSLSKLKAEEEKKKRVHRVFVRKESKLKPVSLPGGKLPRLSGRGRRGSSRI